MKKFGFVFNVLGAFLILAFALADLFGSGGSGGIGAAQLLGIEIGILFILIGAGFIIIIRPEEFKVVKSICVVLDRLLNLSPAFWTVSTFLVLYILFFIYPMFFSDLDSTLKCNRRMEEYFKWRFEVKAFSGSMIELIHGQLCFGQANL